MSQNNSSTNHMTASEAPVLTAEELANRAWDALEAMADQWSEKVNLNGMTENIVSPMKLSKSAPDDVREGFAKRMREQIDAIVRQAYAEGLYEGRDSQHSTITHLEAQIAVLVEKAGALCGCLSDDEHDWPELAAFQTALKGLPASATSLIERVAAAEAENGNLRFALIGERDNANLLKADLAAAETLAEYRLQEWHRTIKRAEAAESKALPPGTVAVCKHFTKGWPYQSCNEGLVGGRAACKQKDCPLRTQEPKT
jgi:hypothetical protein